MNPERRRRIDALLSAALERPDDERGSFLASACEGDEELRVEVQRLLGARQAASSFLEAPPSDAATLDRLTPLLYEQLRRVAKRYMVGQRRGHTFSTTDLINEAYLKLANLEEPEWRDRIHFLSVASRAMRSVLVDYARKRRYAKRGANPVRVSLTGANLTSEQPGEEVLAIDQALRRLSELDPRKSQVVELRYFGGLGIEEVAQVLAISTGTVKREWEKARAWLRGELGRVQGG